MPRVVVAATYTKIKQRMDVLCVRCSISDRRFACVPRVRASTWPFSPPRRWDASLKLNTVHVFDVARAIYFAARKAPAGSVFNLADKGDTDQGRVVRIVCALFNVEAAYAGTIMSNLAQVLYSPRGDGGGTRPRSPTAKLRRSG